MKTRKMNALCLTSFSNRILDLGYISSGSHLERPLVHSLAQWVHLYKAWCDIHDASFDVKISVACDDIIRGAFALYKSTHTSKTKDKAFPSTQNQSLAFTKKSSFCNIFWTPVHEMLGF